DRLKGPFHMSRMPPDPKPLENCTAGTYGMARMENPSRKQLEQLADDLHAENERLRAQLEKMRAHTAEIASQLACLKSDPPPTSGDLPDENAAPSEESGCG